MLLALPAGITSAAEDVAPRSALSQEMQTHAAQTRTARLAIIDGNLQLATQAGTALLARIPAWTLPGSARTLEPALIVPARALAEATTLEAAALALGDIGVACGSCHAAQGSALELKTPAPPPVTEGFSEQMQRVHWASERMWQGLILPSEEAIAESVSVLDTLPAAGFHPERMTALPAAAVETDGNVHQLAALITTRRGWAYGSMLAACASCHTNLPGSPARP